MKTQYISQTLVSGLLVVLSVTSLALLLLRSAVSQAGGHLFAGVFQPGKGSMMELYQRFTAGDFERQGDFLPKYLFVSLILMVAVSLVGFGMSRNSK